MEHLEKSIETFLYEGESENFKRERRLTTMDVLEAPDRVLMRVFFALETLDTAILFLLLDNSNREKLERCVTKRYWEEIMKEVHNIVRCSTITDEIGEQVYKKTRELIREVTKSLFEDCNDKTDKNLQIREFNSAWEREMYAAVQEISEKNKYGVVKLFEKLELISKKYLASGEMKEGDTFKIPLENGVFLMQTFFIQYATLAGENKMKKVMLINEQQSRNKYYANLGMLSSTLETTGIGIGEERNE